MGAGGAASTFFSLHLKWSTTKMIWITVQQNKCLFVFYPCEFLSAFCMFTFKMAYRLYFTHSKDSELHPFNFSKKLNKQDYDHVIFSVTHTVSPSKKEPAQTIGVIRRLVFPARESIYLSWFLQASLQNKLLLHAVLGPPSSIPPSDPLLVLVHIPPAALSTSYWLSLKG